MAGVGWLVLVGVWMTLEPRLVVSTLSRANVQCKVNSDHRALLNFRTWQEKYRDFT